jgi:hypothetical protein
MEIQEHQKMKKKHPDNLMKLMLFCLTHILLNTFLHAIISKETSIIRSDGGGGFDEFMNKVVISLASFFFLLVGTIASIAACRSGETRPFFVALSAASSLALIFFTALSVSDACSDQGGYCRDGHIFMNQTK